MKKFSAFVYLVFLMAGCFSGLVHAAGTPLEKKAEAAALVTEWNREAVRRASNLFISAADEFIALRDDREAASSLREAAKAFLILNEPDQAEASLHRAMQIDSQLGNDEGMAETAVYLTLTFLRTGALDRARSLANDAARYSEQSGSSRARALSSFVEGEVAYKSRDLDVMTRAQERALENYRLASDTYGESEILTYLSYTYTMSNRRQEGLQAAEAAVQLLRGTPNKRGLAFALIAASDASGRLGRWSYAYRGLSEALALFPAGLDQNEYAMLNDRLGVYFETYGDHARAREHYMKALALFEEIQDPVGVSELCSVLAELEAKMGNVDVALAYVARSVEQAKTASDPTPMGLAEESRGQLLLQKGLPTQAAIHFETAIRVYERIGTKQLIAGAYNRLGNAQKANGDPEKARQFFRNALEIGEKIESSVIRADALFYLAEIELAHSNPEEALLLVEQSLDLTAKLYEESALSSLRIKFNSVHRERHDLKVKVLMTLFRATNDVDFLNRSLAASETLRGRVLRENFVLAEAMVDADETDLRALQTLREKLHQHSDKLTDLLSRDADKSEVANVERAISDLEHQLEVHRSDLRQKSPMYSALKDPLPFDLTDFQNTILNEDSILLEYFLGDQESYLWLVGKHGIEAFILPGRAVIETAVDDVLTALNARRTVQGDSADALVTRSKIADAQFTTAANKLSDVILGPVANKLSGKRLIIVPDGKLHFVGLHSLPLNGHGGEPLLAMNEVVYQPSAQTLSMLTKFRTNSGREPDRDILVLSDPVFSRADSRLAGSDIAKLEASPTTSLRFAESLEGLQRLPASGQEAEAIVEIVGESSADLFSGFSATREHLLTTNLSHYKIIHLATHGVLNQERPDLSAVVLSRFDEFGQPLEESVRLQDIYGLKLNADLVVLSACQTGAGKEVRGEGVMGLNGAFLQAGARSVVASLWQVEDNATNILMREFYSGLARGLSVSSALREAQLTLYRDPQYRSPFFWAAFTLQGDMNRRPEIGASNRAQIWSYAIPAGLLLVILAIVWRQRSARKAR